MATALRLLFIFWMVCPFLHFMTAGANTFTVPKLRDSGAVLGQFSFISGMTCVLVMGLFYGLSIPLAICGAVFALGSLVLYEWARRTVVERNFFIGLSGEVPNSVCASGAYRFARHPFYLSYMVAFAGVAVAFPSFWVIGVCLLNMGLFIFMVFDDERALDRSPLAADYANYRATVGMFSPRFSKRS
jgi:protein-S-isoprenylcysteine O-methyltransferase Ste14